MSTGERQGDAPCEAVIEDPVEDQERMPTGRAAASRVEWRRFRRLRDELADDRGGHVGEGGAALGGVLEGVGLGRALLLLREESALVAHRLQLAGDHAEVDHAVAGDGEEASEDRVEERVSLPVDARDHVGPHVLAVDMADP